MKVKVGTYTGTGLTLGVTGVGFQPDLVIVETINISRQTHMRITGMGTNESIPVRADASVVTDAILSNDADGFTLGTSMNVNVSGEAGYYIAIKDDGAGDFKVGTYTGTGSDGNAITGVGFQPNYVLIKSNSNIVGASKYSSGTDSSMQFGGDNRSDLIISLDSDGFTVNDGSGSGANLVNVNATTHYYFAIKSVSNFSTVFQYAGDGTDNRDISTPGFAPGFVIIKSQWGGEPAIRTSAHSGDNAQTWDGAQAANVIQSFSSTGFQVGTSNNSNQNGALLNTLVVKEGTSIAPVVTASASTLLMMGV